MIVVRRLYQYGIAFVSLIMLTIGLSGLGASSSTSWRPRRAWRGRG